MRKSFCSLDLLETQPKKKKEVYLEEEEHLAGGVVGGRCCCYCFCLTKIYGFLCTKKVGEYIWSECIGQSPGSYGFLA